MNELTMMKADVKKVSTKGIKQDRILILSTHKVYLIKKTILSYEKNRELAIKDLECFVKMKDTNEILLQFGGQEDLQLIFEEKEDFLDLIRNMFRKFQPNAILKAFVMTDKENLNDYRIVKSRRGQKRSFGCT